MFSVTLLFYFLCVGCCSRSRGAVSLQEDWKLVLFPVWFCEFDQKWETINLSCSDLVVAHWCMFFFHYREHTHTFSLIDCRNNITAKKIQYSCDESYVDNMILLQNICSVKYVGPSAALTPCEWGRNWKRL